jgi:hypothetical protein
MKRHSGRVAGPLAAAVATVALAWSTTASAEVVAVVQGPPPVPAPAPAAPAATPEEVVRYTTPNRGLIGTGLVTFGLAYAPAAVVAGESSLEADHHLFVPVAGPWLNLAARPPCGAGNIACDTEKANRVLLVVDGVFQGLGVLTTICAFLSPEREVVTTTPGVAAAGGGPTIHFSPAQMGAGGVGAAAFGTF